MVRESLAVEKKSSNLLIPSLPSPNSANINIVGCLFGISSYGGGCDNGYI